MNRYFAQIGGKRQPEGIRSLSAGYFRERRGILTVSTGLKVRRGRWDVLGDKLDKSPNRNKAYVSDGKCFLLKVFRFL